MTVPRVERPGLYYPKLPATWWLRNANYFRFMLRELSSVFIALFLVVFLVQLHRLPQGPGAYAAYLDTLRAPGWIIFHVVALAFALYHSVTWFNLTGGLAVPLGWTSISHARMLALAAQPLVKLYLFALIALPLYHWAHRFRFILEDLGLRGLRTPIALLSYGAAVLGTVATLWVLWQI